MATAKTKDLKPKARKKKDEQAQEEPTQIQMEVQTQPEALDAGASQSDPAAIIQEETQSAAVNVKQEQQQQRRIRPIQEQFDLNSTVLAGVIHSVWGRNADVFARLAVSHRDRLVEDDEAFISFVTLRVGDGVLGERQISVQPGDVVRVRGYLTHMEYNESLRKFLDDAHSMNFLDLVDPADLDAWRSLTFRRHNAIMNVSSMSILDRDGQTLAHFGEAFQETGIISNRSSVEGIVARVWEYPHDEDVDIFTRLAVYDEYTALDVKRAEGNFGRARRKAHYITVRFPAGKTSCGSPVRLKPKTRVRVAGELRDKGQVVTLRGELLKTGMPVVAEMMGRVSNAERMSEISAQQETLHILADAVVVYSANGGSRR